MLNTILGSKIKMGQTFVEGTRVPVTYVKAGPCVVTQIRSKDKDGHWSVQLGFGDRKIKNVTKPLQGHLRGVIKENKAPRFLREVRLEAEPEFKVGDIISVPQIFTAGDLISVTGISKGKGFAGVVKRWKFAGGPKTHGQSDRQRAPGSIGQTTTPGRIYKGKKMAGRMGSDKVTVKNLRVITVLSESNELAVSGPVPGIPGNLLIIRKLAAGKLEELVEEAPQPQIHEGEGAEEATGEVTDEKGESQKVQKETEGAENSVPSA